MIIRLLLGNEILPDTTHFDSGMAVAAQTAAKTALQNGAAEVAERLLPKLVKYNMRYLNIPLST